MDKTRNRRVSRKASMVIGASVGVALLGSGVANAQQATSASAELRDGSGTALGTATFTQAADGIQISGSVRGLAAGQHGWHVHAVGRCDPPDFTSAGGHFNPTGKQHGHTNPQGAHVGDLGNLTAAADGSARLSGTAAGATLTAGSASLFDADGSALVIHAGPDDEVTDPAGNSGARVACGVIVAGAQAAPAQMPTALPRTGDVGALGALAAAAGAGLAGFGVALRRWRRRG